MNDKKNIRKNNDAWKKYKSPRWLSARKAFLYNNPLCVNYKECHNFANHVDHITPVESDKDARFWDKSNWQGLCESCHSKKTAAEDGAFGNKKKNEKPKTRLYITCVAVKDDMPVLKKMIISIAEKYKRIDGVNFIEAKSKDDETLYKKMFSVKTLPVIIMSEKLDGTKKQSAENVKRFSDKNIFDNFEKELKENK